MPRLAIWVETNKSNGLLTIDCRILNREQATRAVRAVNHTPHIMSTIMRTLRNLRKIGLKVSDHGHCLNCSR
jgi:hypothetical protein